jgi:sortase A
LRSDLEITPRRYGLTAGIGSLLDDRFLPGREDSNFMKQPKGKTKKTKQRLIVIFLAIISALLIAYPYISNISFEMATDSTIATMKKEGGNTADKYADEIAAAKEYNARLTKYRVSLAGFSDEDVKDSDADAEYDDLLNMTSDGAMGFIEIPCIDVTLLVYHGQSDEVLKKGVGHIKGTSLPVGGESTHTVLTGHTGLSSAKLFTDLDNVEMGDVFFLNVMGETLAYKVDQIMIVTPDDTSDLTIVDGKDYCTLVTCTPYGINSHRLLVRGERTDYEGALADEESSTRTHASSQWLIEYNRALVISALLFALGLMIMLIIRKLKEKKKNKK